jgi:hypothetical protein
MRPVAVENIQRLIQARAGCGIDAPTPDSTAVEGDYNFLAAGLRLHYGDFAFTVLSILHHPPPASARVLLFLGLSGAPTRADAILAHEERERLAGVSRSAANANVCGTVALATPAIQRDNSLSQNLSYFAFRKEQVRVH